MLRKGRGSAKRLSDEQSKFTLAKARVLATTELMQRSGINSAATYAMDGHSVDLSEELVEQKPSIVSSQDWDTAEQKPVKSPSANSGTIRVCWQCPEVSTVFSHRQSTRN